MTGAPENAGKFLPQVAPIEQFGAGGFRFAGMSHQGALMVLPSGMRAWRPVLTADISAEDFAAVNAERQDIDFLIIGTGETLQRLPPAVQALLKGWGIAFEVMATSSAVHVYNVVVAERRRVAAVLLAVGEANA